MHRIKAELATADAEVSRISNAVSQRFEVLVILALNHVLATSGTDRKSNVNAWA